MPVRVALDMSSFDFCRQSDDDPDILLPDYTPEILPFCQELPKLNLEGGRERESQIRTLNVSGTGACVAM